MPFCYILNYVDSGAGHRANDDRLLDRNTGISPLRRDRQMEIIARQRGFHGGDNGPDPEQGISPFGSTLLTLACRTRIEARRDYAHGRCRSVRRLPSRPVRGQRRQPVLPGLRLRQGLHADRNPGALEVLRVQEEVFDHFRHDLPFPQAGDQRLPEPPRVSRRLRLLRGWSHGNQENSEELLA
jgi:hypothetical protein